jgi:hypothetical protein
MQAVSVLLVVSFSAFCLSNERLSNYHLKPHQPSEEKASAKKAKQLLILAKNGASEEFKKLLHIDDNVAIVNGSDKNDLSILYHAMSGLHEHTVSALCERKRITESGVPVPSDWLKNSTEKAAGYQDIINAIIDHKNFKVRHNYKWEEDLTFPVDWAVKFGQFELLLPLLKLDKTVQSRSYYFVKNVKPHMDKLAPEVRAILAEKQKK